MLFVAVPLRTGVGAFTRATAALTGINIGPSYGLGVFNAAGPYATAVGHTGTDYGFASWAGCLPAQGVVVVVLTNQEKDDIRTLARPLVLALTAGG